MSFFIPLILILPNYLGELGVWISFPIADVLATIVRMGGTIDDLIELELAYAPPYSSAKDPFGSRSMAQQKMKLASAPADNM